MYIINGETESWESGIAIQFERNLKGLHASIYIAVDFGFIVSTSVCRYGSKIMVGSKNNIDKKNFLIKILTN